MNKALIIVNPQCRQGKGWKRWLSIRDDVRRRFSVPVHEIVLEDGLALRDALHLQSGEKTCIVSAGGDGSVHFLVNHLLNERRSDLPNLVLGAVGLGSSNDFLKPFGETILGVPVRLAQTGGSVLHDVGVADYCNERGVERRKFFIVNASLGVTAQANWRFNHPGTVLRFLKKNFTSGAIAYTAISTILSHRNAACRIGYNGTETEVTLSNANVLKSPYVSGSFYYNQAIERDDGRLGLNLCLGLSKRELLSVLAGLQKGKFNASPKTVSTFTTDASFTANEPFVFECDGETEKTTALRLSVLPCALAVLKS